MLEESQKAVRDALNNQDSTKLQNSTAILRQEQYNDNRRMMSELLAPLSHQLHDMRVMFEGTKSASGEVSQKIEEFKRLMLNAPGAVNGPMLSTTIGAVSPIEA